MVVSIHRFDGSPGVCYRLPFCVCEKRLYWDGDKKSGFSPFALPPFFGAAVGYRANELNILCISIFDATVTNYIITPGFTARFGSARSDPSIGGGGLSACQQQKKGCNPVNSERYFIWAEKLGASTASRDNAFYPLQDRYNPICLRLLPVDCSLDRLEYCFKNRFVVYNVRTDFATVNKQITRYEFVSLRLMVFYRLPLACVPYMHWALGTISIRAASCSVRLWHTGIQYI